MSRYKYVKNLSPVNSSYLFVLKADKYGNAVKGLPLGEEAELTEEQYREFSKTALLVKVEKTEARQNVVQSSESSVKNMTERA